MSRRIAGPRLAHCAWIVWSFAGTAFARQEDPPSTLAPTLPAKQALDDAWWTGPLIANSPAPLAKGHVYAESYFYDARSPGVHRYGSQTYLLYGLTEKTTVGLRPSFGYVRAEPGRGGSHAGVGDLTLHAQHALTVHDPQTRTPGIAIAFELTLPTGRHDRLRRIDDGFGSGAYTTALGLYGQQYFWLRNGRILRGRINLGGEFSRRARVRGASVYGTEAAFAGYARPGSAFFLGNAWEYSVTRNWVLAMDLHYRHDAKASVRGVRGPAPAAGRSRDTFSIAPAIEFNWSPRIGVIAGGRYVLGRGGNAESVTPIVALSVLM